MLGSPTESQLQVISEAHPNFKLAAHPNWQQIKLTDAYDAPFVMLDAMHSKREKAYFKILELKYVLGY